MAQTGADRDDSAGGTLLGGNATQAGLASWLQSAGAMARPTKRAPGGDPGLAKPMSLQTSIAVGDLLKTNVVDMLLEAWRTKGALHDAARETAHDPGRVDHVKLAAQTVTWTTSTNIDLLVDEMLVDTVAVTLQVIFEITALEADVRAGRIYMFEAGGCTVSASLSVDGIQLAQRRLIDIGAPVRLRIESGGPPDIAPPPPTIAPVPPPPPAVV